MPPGPSGGPAPSLPEGILGVLLIVPVILLVIIQVLVQVLVILRLLMVHLQELRLRRARQLLWVQLILRALELLQRLYVQMPVHELRPLRPRGTCLTRVFRTTVQ